MTSPDLSVIIPAFNAGRFVASAVSSVLREAPGVQLIVVDDASTDDTRAQLSAFGEAITVVDCERNGGIAVAMNRGVAASRGGLIGFVDADDVWLAGRHGVEQALLADQTDIDATWGKAAVRFEAGVTAPPDPDGWQPRHFPALGSMIFRRRVFDRVGPFKPDLRHAHDIDFMARCQEAGVRFLRHDHVVLEWRRHAANMTNQVAVDRDYFVSAVRQALLRRRARQQRDDDAR